MYLTPLKKRRLSARENERRRINCYDDKSGNLSRHRRAPGLLKLTGSKRFPGYLQPWLICHQRGRFSNRRPANSKHSFRPRNRRHFLFHELSHVQHHRRSVTAPLPRGQWARAFRVSVLSGQGLTFRLQSVGGLLLCGSEGAIYLPFATPNSTISSRRISRITVSMWSKTSI